MRLGNYLRFLSVVIGSAIASPVFANNWEITFFGQQSTQGQFVSSPSAHCATINSMPASGITDGRTYTDATFKGFTDAQGQPTSDPETIRGALCEFMHPWYGYPWRAAYTLNVPCVAPSIIDPQTGICSLPEDNCAEKAGIEELFSKSGIAPDGFAFVSANGTFGTQRQGCKGGCATEITDVRLKGKVSGAYYARGTAVYSGQQCATTGTGDQIAEDTNESTDPETVKEDKPCVYSSSGGAQVCESKTSEETEGQSCGTVNGVQTCLSKPPSKNGIDIRTEVTTETNADGSTTTTKKDTATATTCKGVNNCTTKTATTTTTTKKDATGNTTSVGSTCTGDACPDRNTDPDGNGDGLGDCAAGSKDCGAGRGEGQDWYTPGDDTFASVLTQFSAAVKQTPIASQTTQFLTFSASGSCPQWSVSVWVFDIDIDQLCSGKIPWDAIKAVVLAAAAFLAFRIALF